MKKLIASIAILGVIAGIGFGSVVQTSVVAESEPPIALTPHIG